jgi:hypothetical protein
MKICQGWSNSGYWTSWLWDLLGYWIVSIPYKGLTSITGTEVKINCFLNWYSGGGGGGVQLGPLGTAATNRPIVPAPGDYDDGEIGGMIGRGNRSTRRKPAPMPLCPPKTPHAARTRTLAAMVGSQRLTAWATARPWLRLDLSNRSNRVRVSPPSIWERKQVQFPKRCGLLHHPVIEVSSF